jgi:hypothetical protein
MMIALGARHNSCFIGRIFGFFGIWRVLIVISRGRHQKITLPLGVRDKPF